MNAPTRFDPLTDEAMRVLRDIKDPLSNGDNLDGLVDRLIDDTTWLRAFAVAVLKADQDGIDVARGHVSMQATHYAFATARDYLEARAHTQDPHDTYGVSRGPL